MTPEVLAENPFYVLEVPTTASRLEVERAGQKLLALLGIGAATAKTHATPFGDRARDEASVRAAVAALRDPRMRLRYELWVEIDMASDDRPEHFAWRDAFRSVDWSGPCTAE